MRARVRLLSGLFGLCSLLLVAPSAAASAAAPTSPAATTSASVPTSAASVPTSTAAASTSAAASTAAPLTTPTSDSALVSRVLAALRGDPLYVAPQVAVAPDAALVRRALAGSRVPTYVVVLRQREVDSAELGIDGLMLQIVEGLADPRAVLLVVSDGGELQAGDGGRTGVDASAVLDAVIAERLEEPFGAGPLTGAVVDVVTRIGQRRTDAVTPSSPRRTIGLVGLVAVAALGGGGLLYRRGQRRLAAQAPLTNDLVATEPGWH